MADEQSFRSWPTLLSLGYGLLVGPTAWFVHLLVSYVLGGFLCEADATWALHAATLLALAASATGLLPGLSLWRRSRGVAGDAAARTRFLAGSGVAFSAFFALLIALAGLTNFFLDPCGAP